MTRVGRGRPAVAAWLPAHPFLSRPWAAHTSCSHQVAVGPMPPPRDAPTPDVSRGDRALVIVTVFAGG